MNYYFDAWKKYAVFTGRSTRKEYWMFVLINLIASIIVSIVGASLRIKHLDQIYGLAVLLPGIGIGIRRLHDIGRSGWWMLIGLIPIVGTIILIVFQVKEGQPGENKYGTNPKKATNNVPPPTVSI
jgi:uncharacterized membrane protein YhaH (DUF805 family)